MFFDNNEQQSLDSFHYTSPYWTSVTVSKNEFNENMLNTARSSHAYSPVLKLNGDDVHDNNENKSSNEKLLVEQLKAQLIHNQRQRSRIRDYPRILRQSNTPADWYRTSSLSRSVYFYDPNYQRYVQQRSSLLQKTPPNTHSVSPKPTHTRGHLTNQSSFIQHSSISYTPRSKHMLDLYSTSINSHQLKQVPYQNLNPPTPNVSQRYPSAQSRFSSVPILPPIHTPKQRVEQEFELLNTNENHQPIIVDSRKKFNPIVMPPTS